MRNSKGKVFVAMSGGVDSSVAAYLLKKQNYDVVGVFMRCWSWSGPSTELGASCAERDAEDARRVAEKLQIPFYVFDFEEEYKKRVVEYMISGYREGIAPNPDVMCNKEIKFGMFLKKALNLGADFIATGHYLRLRKSAHNESRRNKRINEFVNLQEIRYLLMSARDAQKDQSYFLWTLTQNQLRHCLFPIGDYLKSEVREIARKTDLPTADKKDSQGICFLGKVTLGEFLGNYIPGRRGEVLDVKGEKIGEHRGAQFYTIGQRHLGIKNYESRIKGRHETQPHYVAEKNTRTNILVVAEGENNPALHKKEVELQGINFINLDVPSLIRAPARRSKSEGRNGGIKVLARVRYRQPLEPAKLTTGKLGNYKLEFDQPVKFVAAGQSAVFYSRAGELLGGGIIA